MSEATDLRLRSPRTRALAVVFAAGAVGCMADAGPGAVPLAEVRDSAGITIVENPALGAEVDLGWSLDSVPLLDVGTLEGPPETQLYRVVDAQRLSDGGVAVLNAGTAEVRIFSADGRHRATLGRRGGGPGEFMAPGGLHPWSGDSLAVWDARGRRITVFGPDGSMGRILSLPMTDGGLPRTLSHRLPGGELAALSFDLLGDAPQNGYRRVPVQVEHLDAEGRPVADLGTVPGNETLMTIAGERVSLINLPFARRFVVAPHGAETLVAPTDRLELRFFGTEGDLVRIVRVAQPPRLTTDEDRRAELERRLANAPEESHPALRTSFREHPGSDTLPAFVAVLDDALGDTWVRTFRSPADTGPDRWIVLRQDGTARGVVSLPAPIDVFEIGADWILGGWTDDLDVERVRMWRLRRDDAMRMGPRG
ncbi:MAG TPA: hypothetical protein VLA36_16445 [Longimicrobiales bacterium]|nr:hypothetical protein [Longimicrobiales bacterium]